MGMRGMKHSAGASQRQLAYQTLELHWSLEEQQGVLVEQLVPVPAHGLQKPPEQTLVEGLQQSEVAAQPWAPPAMQLEPPLHWGRAA